MSVTRKLQAAVTATALCVSLAPLGVAQTAKNEQPDLSAITAIRNEGFHHSQVMETLEILTDQLGARLAGSSNYKRAAEWTRERLNGYGLANAHLESFEFGRGWQLDSITVRMTSPDVAMLLAYPKAWTPAVKTSGEVVRLKASSTADLEKYKGKLAGKIVLIGDNVDIQPDKENPFIRYDAAALTDIANYAIPGAGGMRFPGMPSSPEEMRRRMSFMRELPKFLESEKVAATVEAGRGQNGIITVQGTQNYKPGSPDGYAQIVVAAEQFNRIARLLDRNIAVTLDIDAQSHFENPDNNKSYNVVAELPGTDKKDEVVIAGGHLDSWHAGTGATDNGVGAVVAMEALRILKASGLKPRRTIRVALWAAEEEGLLGSRAYVEQHYGKRVDAPGATVNPDIPSFMRQPNGPFELKEEQKHVAAYFNIDNGSGKLRGVYTQENAAVAPIFEAWGAPFKDVGFTTVTERNTGSTDHVSLDAVGIPAFQFVQDPLDYFAHTHHTNMDVYERAQREDLEQAAVILASFLYDAAQRDEMLPRKTLPAEVKFVDAAATPAAPAKPEAKKKKAA